MCNSVENNGIIWDGLGVDFFVFWCVCSGIQNLFLTKSQVAPQRLIRDPCQSMRATLRKNLTMTSTFLYTINMIKIIKDHGLLDWDFVSTLSVISTLLILAEVI